MSTPPTTTGWARRAVVGALGLVVGVACLPATADAQGESAEAELAARYAPIVVVREQSGPCDHNGEPFEPAPVEIVLDNPEILLRMVGNGDPVVVRGPSASDLFDLREGWYLDFPGDALAPGCIFEQDFRRFSDGRSVVYAHIATESDHPGFVALQYWMFWYHNPAKNNHEGDWEFVQILFEADSAADALSRAPVSIGYAQHTGGERAAWDDPKLERVGDRPVVYAARGSHASYFAADLYLGRSSREGFGCDNTTGPSRRLDPAVVVLPDRVADADDPLAWLAFQGRWGQREPGFLNGPTGPFAKARWTEPVSWTDDLRSSSVVIPSGDRFGNDVIRWFCGAVETGSRALTSTLRSPAVGLSVAALTVIAAVLVARRTTWTPVTTRPLRASRATGQILRASWRVWLRHPRAMLIVGAVYVPAAMITAIAQRIIFAIPFVDDVVDLAGDRSGVAFALTMLVGGIADLLTFVFVVACVARVVDGDQGEPHRVIPTVAELGQLLAAVARATVIVVALLISVIGIPWGIRALVRYQFAPHAIVLEGHTGHEALRRSTDIVRGRWWWTAAFVVGVEVAITVAGFSAAVAVLLLVRTLPLWAFNLVGALIYVALVPIGAAAVTYAYGSLVTGSTEQTDAAAEPDVTVTTSP